MLQKYILIFILIFYSSIPIFAQNPFIEKEDWWVYFEHDTINLGKIDFSTSHKVIYTFYSLLEQGLKIKDIQPDCSCLLSNYTKESLKYGDKGFIDITVDPYKPGLLEQNIVVNFQYQNKKLSYYLYLKADVQPTIEQDLVNYPYQIGSLKMKTQKINLGVINNDQITKRQICFYNEANYNLKFHNVVSGFQHINIIFPKDRIILAKTVTCVNLYYNAQITDNFGLVSENIVLFVDDSKTLTIPIDIEATIVKKVEQHFQELLPSLSVDFTVKKLSHLKLYLPIQINFTLKNKGKGELIIYKIIPQAGCMVKDFHKVWLKTGQEMDLKIVINPIDKRGIQKRTVTIYTNDHKNPKQDVVIILRQ